MTPVTFFKPNTAVIGPGDPIRLPAVSEHVSYEPNLPSSSAGSRRA